MTEILQASVSNVERVARMLKEGSVVAFPTETVYGLGASVLQPAALCEIFRVKNRPADNPLILHISSLEQVEKIAEEVPALFFQLAAHFFPGPLTVVLKKAPSVESCISGGRPSVALRMPAHPIAHALIAAVGSPLAAPSANLSGRPSSTEAAHVLEDFQGLIPAILDGGRCQFGLESTVVSLLEGEPVLLRPGAIPKEALEKILGKEVKEGKACVSPGMKYRHYAPKKRLYLFRSEREWKETPPQEPHCVLRNVTGESLYRRLREADQADRAVAVIYEGKDPVLLNRLHKAAEW